MSGSEIAAGRLVVPGNSQYGPDGPAGVQGAAGPYHEAPADGRVYGRDAAATWLPVLPLAGRTLGDAAATLSNGISFGSVESSDARRHLLLAESRGFSVGFGVSGGTLHWVGAHRFYTGTNLAGEIGGGGLVGGGTRIISFYGATHEWPTYRNGAIFLGSNIFPNSRNENIFGGTVLPRMGHWGIVGNGHLYITNELWVSDRGLRTANWGSWHNWDWDGQYIWGRVNNEVAYPIANACDERLKQDIQPATFDCLAALRRVRLYRYHWQDFGLTARAADDDEHPIGFVAQRLEEDFPEAVVRGKQEQLVGAVYLHNADVNTLLATLCGAVQQLDARVRALRGG